MKFLLAALIATALTGCAASSPLTAKPAEQAPTAKVSSGVAFSEPTMRPTHVESPVHPTVVVIGDSIVNAWLTAPPSSWMALGTPEGLVEETSAEVLARFPEAIALQPKIIVVEAGTWDVATTDVPSPDGVCADPADTCTNLMLMVDQANDAGIPIILGTVPPWGNGPLATEINPVNPDATLDDLNQFILHYGGGSPGIMPTDPPGAPYPAGVSVIDYHAFLAVLGEDGQSDDFADSDGDVYAAAYTTDGVTPNAAGGAVMTSVTETAVAAVIK